MPLWSRRPVTITPADTRNVPLGDVLWEEIDRLRNIIRAAQETIEEIHPRAQGALSDDLLDLWNILKQGENSNVRAASDR